MCTTESVRLAELRRYEILDTQPEASFDRLTQLAARSCAMPIALISIVDEHRLWFKSCSGLSLTEASRERALCAHTILGSEPFIVQDASLDPRFENSALVKAEPAIRFYAGVPLQSPLGIALGTLCVIDRCSRNITAAQIDTLKILAQQIVQQFELHRITQALRRQSDSLERTQATAHIGGWELDLTGGILTWSQETYRIHELESAGFVPTVTSAISFYSPASQVRIRAAMNALLEAGTPYDLELQLITKSGRHRWVRVTGRRDAATTANSRISGVFQDITERRNLESEILLIAQREQSRMGLDLHDGLGQTLTGVSLLLGHAITAVPDTLPKVHQNLNEIKAYVTEAIATCRVLAHGLAPVSQQRGGLPPALRQLGVRLEQVHGIKILVDIHGFAQPPESVADHLYRIAQEALTNAIRHAGAMNIRLLVDLNADRILLTVTDDGQGIPASAIADGLGISIMRYRARLIGAVLTIEHRSPAGTEVSCVLDAARVGEPARDAVWAS